MILHGLFTALIGVALAVERRDHSLTSSLVSYVLQRSNYNSSRNEYSRVTQTPIVKVHLRKTFLPSTIHSALKTNLGERQLSRAGEVEHDNARQKDALFEAMASLDNLEKFSEQEFKVIFPEKADARTTYKGMAKNAIGLSDYALLSSKPAPDGSSDYVILERRKLKPSELETEDTERSHMPTLLGKS